MSDRPTRFVLQPHPADGLAAVAGAVSVELLCQAAPGSLQIVYDIHAPQQPLLQPPEGAVPQRRDGLWRHTCCELFIAACSAESAYLEFNFSPSGDWAAYAFDAPRQGMRPFLWQGSAAPRIRMRSAGVSPHRLRVEVELPAPLPAGEFRLAPTVILETSAGISHWAARHPGGQPDFHHPAGFSDPLPLIWGLPA